MKASKEDLVFIGILAAVLLLFFNSILGIAGAVSIFTIVIIFFIPSYLLLDNFSLSKDEKIVFSFFAGVGVFPAISYWLGLFISFKVSILVTFVVLVLASFLVGKLIKK